MADDDKTTYDSRPETYEHIHQVHRLMNVVIGALQRRALLHDRSKLRTPEREIFDEATKRLWGLTFASEEYERVKRDYLGKALAHHYAANRHHPEWHRDGIEGMDLLDLIEMMCDWMAATKRHEDGDIRRSIEINQDRFGYTDEIKRLLHNTADVLEPYM